MKKYSFIIADKFDQEIHYLRDNWIVVSLIRVTWILVDKNIWQSSQSRNNNISYKIQDNIKFIFDNLLSDEY